MPESTNNQFDVQSAKKPWHHSPKKVLWITVLGIFILGILVFVGFFGYYAWEIKYGDAEALINAADESMYAAKQGGKNAYRFYS